VSYILEALQKSERERQRSERPSIHTHYAIGIEDARHAPTTWIKWLAMAALVGGAVAGAVLWPEEHQFVRSNTISYPPEHINRQHLRANGPNQMGQSGKTNHRSRVLQEAPMNAIEPARPSSQPSDAHSLASLPVTGAPVKPAIQPHPAVPASRSEAIAPASDGSSQPGQVMEQARMPDDATPVQNTPVRPAEKQDIPAISQLPANLQASIPAINIAGHIYADAPGGRMVMINGRIAHEGDAVASGLVLDAITPDGVILKFKETRFHMSVFQHWPPGG